MRVGGFMFTCLQLILYGSSTAYCFVLFFCLQILTEQGCNSAECLMFVGGGGKTPPEWVKIHLQTPNFTLTSRHLLFHIIPKKWNRLRVCVRSYIETEQGWEEESGGGREVEGGKEGVCLSSLLNRVTVGHSQQGSDEIPVSFFGLISIPFPFFCLKKTCLIHFLYFFPSSSLLLFISPLSLLLFDRMTAGQAADPGIEDNKERYLYQSIW